jgi:hypothetical protein
MDSALSLGDPAGPGLQVDECYHMEFCSFLALVEVLPGFLLSGELLHR